MPHHTPDTAEVLAFAVVQEAIGKLIVEAARETGIADRHAQKMRLSIVSRIAEGSPVESAIRLVDVIREVITPHVVD